ncbi:hypothetical protein [Pseudooceanicola sp. LIPI14-2-Ac024]|uniref:hypothetical protein n=1 Tax=Pseudooceanicola sp. LIPI14-2-Ac024 TaxID=3344875 RepID=UPI0035CFDE41
MARKFIATILAAALSVTAIAAPAQARNNDDLVKFLAGATALVIIGKALHDKNTRDNDRDDHVTRYRPDWDDRRDHRPGRGYDRDHGRDHGRANIMPASCRVNVRTPNGTVSGYGYDCVQQHPRIARNVPGQCVTATRAHRGPQFVYTDRCLARSGFRVN